jgi:CHAD domain-containing protein
MQAESPRELEAKFTLARQEELDALIDAPGLPDGFVVGDSSVVSVADVYVDTLDMRLLRHGYTLRLRSKDSKRLVTLKSLESLHAGHIQNRMEIEKPLALGSQQFDPLGWPQDIQNIVFAIAGDEPQLQPVCVVRQTRHKVWIHGGAINSKLSDFPLAELSLDQVAVSSGDSRATETTEPLSEGAASRFFEVELELLDPTQESTFFTLVRWLESRSELSPVHTSKLVSGLRAVAVQPLDRSTNREIDRLGIQPEMQMADACRLIWRQQTIEMCLNEAGVRADQDMEYVHAMRLATRRARAAYELLGDNIKRKQVQNHVRFFKRMAKKLGAVRDLDIVLQKLQHHSRRLTAEKRGELKPVAQYWRSERLKKVKELHEWLDSDAYALSLIELGVFCRTPGAGTKRDGTIEDEPPLLIQVRHVLPTRVLARFAAVRRYEIVFALPEPKSGPESVSLTMLHALRIDCKYLRYVLEFARNLLGPQGETIITQLKELQKVLGNLNDADVAHGMLQSLPADLNNDDGQRHAVAAYIDEQEAIIEKLRRRVPVAFWDFIAPENISLLAQAIAEL